MKRISKGAWVAIFMVALLIIDQIIKIVVKMNMTIGESIPVFGTWFQILFVENEGMAFGMKFGGHIGKIILSLFRIVLTGAIIVYIKRLLKKEDVPMGVLLGLSAIACGAFGNIIDSLLYGVVFSASTFTQVATFLPAGGGYAAPLMGKVVDMFYFPIIDTVLPSWVPFWGGKHFTFFNAIFNFADSCITVGAIYLLIFQWRFFNRKEA